MLIPIPLHDEFYKGHVGRIQTLNSLPDYQRTNYDIRNLARSKGAPREGEPTIVSLARLCQIPLEEYLQFNTLLPYHSFYQHKKSHVSDMRWSTGTISRCGTLPCRSAYYCEQCVRGDLRRHGFSYWRRIHQLPGMMWCLKHRSPLREYTAAFPFDVLPDKVINRFGKSAQQGSSPLAVRRFLEISALLLEQRKLITESDFKLRLNKLARSVNLRVSQRGSRLLPSDVAMKVFPSDWLVSVFPRIRGKQYAEYFPAIDAVTRVSSWNSATAGFIIVLSILFDRADDAIAWLFDDSPARISLPLQSIE
jgi:hypothetical protein